MASHPGKVFTRDEIFKNVWKRNHLSKERTIDVHILRLRKNLGRNFFQHKKVSDIGFVHEELKRDYTIEMFLAFQ